MKSLKLFALVLLAGVVAFSSCKKDDELDPPTISVSPTSTDAWQGDTVTITVTMAGNQTLKELTITPDVDASQGETITDLSGDYSASYEYQYVVGGSVTDGGYITITCKVTDEEDLSETTSATINIVEPAASGNPIDEFTAVLMGAQSNATEGSYMDASTGQVYTMSSAAQNQALIDVVYYYGSTNFATLCAPNDATVGGGSGNLTLCEGWTTKNATKFAVSSVTATEFDGMTDDEVIATLANLSDTKVTSLDQNDVVAFETADGTKGLMKVTAVTTGTTGSITVNVKIQQ